MLSTKYASFLGYIRLDLPPNANYYTFPLPVIGEELNSENPTLVLGLECNDAAMLDFLIDNFTATSQTQLAVVDLPLAPHIICPFLSIIQNNVLITAPIYPYCDFIRPYVSNSKLVKTNKLRIEIYSDNIEILSADVISGFSPDLLLDDSSYSRYPAFSLIELLEYVTPESFSNISHYIFKSMTSQLE